MDREELNQKIEELNELSDEVKSRYRAFYKGVTFTEFRGIHEDTGESVRKRKIASPGDEGKMSESIKLYEEWFSQAEVLVKNFYPSRIDEFRELAGDFRKLITLSRRPLPFSSKDLRTKTDSKYNGQIGILNSLVSRKEISEMRFRKQVKENLALEEIERAERLCGDDLIRPAGVLAGVALERHLKTILDENEETGSNFDVNIGEAADELYENGIISSTKKDEIMHYSSVRNDCAHSGHEIDEIQVEKMISSVEDFIRRR